MVETGAGEQDMKREGKCDRMGGEGKRPKHRDRDVILGEQKTSLLLVTCVCASVCVCACMYVCV